MEISYSEDFLRQIFKITNKVILVFDNDESGYKSMYRFMTGYERKKRRKFIPPNKFYKRVKYFLYPSQFMGCKDINKISSKYDINDMYSIVVENSYSYSSTYTKLHIDRALKKIVSKLGGNIVNEVNTNRKRLYWDK